MNGIRKIAIFEFLTLILGIILIASAVSTPSLAAPPRSARVYTDGTRAAEAWFNPNSPAWFDLLDAKCDAHAVYVQYSIEGGRQIRKDNNGGCGTTLHIPLTNGSFNIVYKVCVNIQLGPDVCSALTGDHQ